jgi:hypothetical protein
VAFLFGLLSLLIFKARQHHRTAIYFGKSNYLFAAGLVIWQNTATIKYTLSHKVRHDNFQIN